MVKLAVGGEVTLRGMGTVFAVLILIWFLVELLHLILGDKTKPVEKKTETAPIPEKIEAPAPLTVPEVTTTVPGTIDEAELIVIITAAVATASGSSPDSFRVVYFKRANNRFANGK